ncbi:hypothetical protein ACJZ2D_011317 [Fusarium nematophilum]
MMDGVTHRIRNDSTQAGPPQAKPVIVVIHITPGVYDFTKELVCLRSIGLFPTRVIPQRLLGTTRHKTKRPHLGLHSTVGMVLVKGTPAYL